MAATALTCAVMSCCESKARGAMILCQRTSPFDLRQCRSRKAVLLPLKCDLRSATATGSRCPTLLCSRSSTTARWQRFVMATVHSLSSLTPHVLQPGVVPVLITAFSLSSLTHQRRQKSGEDVPVTAHSLGSLTLQRGWRQADHVLVTAHSLSSLTPGVGHEDRVHDLATAHSMSSLTARLHGDLQPVVPVTAHYLSSLTAALMRPSVIEF